MQYEIGLSNRLGNRSTNQDRISAIEEEEGILLVLADGMGGTTHGELAAQTLIEEARDLFENVPKPIKNPEHLFNLIVTRAHNRIMDICRREEIINPPGTTAVFCLVQGEHIAWGHIGDSRFYLFHEGLALLRTIDHSYVEELYQKGAITRSEQDSHPRRNHITQCIGCLPQLPKVTMGKGGTLGKEDVVLMCSDGLWGALDDAQIGSLLTDAPLGEIVDELSQRAETNSYPRSDNISVIALRLKEEAVAPKPPAAKAQAPAKPAPRDSGEELQQAIDQIEEMIKQYEGELDEEN